MIAAEQQAAVLALKVETVTDQVERDAAVFKEKSDGLERQVVRSAAIEEELSKESALRLAAEQRVTVPGQNSVGLEEKIAALTAEFEDRIGLALAPIFRLFRSGTKNGARAAT